MSSMNFFMKRMPRPFGCSRFSGSSGSRTGDGSKPVALVLDPDDQLVPLERQVDVDLLVRILLVAVLDRVGDRLADGQVDPVPGVLVDAEPFERVA